MLPCKEGKEKPDKYFFVFEVRMQGAVHACRWTVCIGAVARTSSSVPARLHRGNQPVLDIKFAVSLFLRLPWLENGMFDGGPGSSAPEGTPAPSEHDQSLYPAPRGDLGGYGFSWEVYSISVRRLRLGGPCMCCVHFPRSTLRSSFPGATPRCRLRSPSCCTDQATLASSRKSRRERRTRFPWCVLGSPTSRRLSTRSA